MEHWEEAQETIRETSEHGAGGECREFHNFILSFLSNGESFKIIRHKNTFV